MQYGHCIYSQTVKQAAFDLQQKETGNKTVAIAKSKYESCGAFLSVQRACQIPIVLHHYLQRYSTLCFDFHIVTYCQNVSFCLTYDSRPSTSIAQSIVLSHHHQ